MLRFFRTEKRIIYRNNYRKFLIYFAFLLSKVFRSSQKMLRDSAGNGFQTLFYKKRLCHLTGIVTS